MFDYGHKHVVSLFSRTVMKFKIPRLNATSHQVMSLMYTAIVSKSFHSMDRYTLEFERCTDILNLPLHPYVALLALTDPGLNVNVDVDVER